MRCISCLGVENLRFGRMAVWRSMAIVAVLAMAFGFVPASLAQAPQLVSVEPANGATGVARTAGMVFVFDQPMDTTVDLMPSFPPFLMGNFEWNVDFSAILHQWQWSEDGRTLTGTPFFGEFPAGTLVTWKLNPSGGGDDPFVSESGVPLPETTGSFTTSGQSTGQEGDEDCDGFPDAWGSYSVFKGVSYEQRSAADPALSAESPVLFGAGVSGSEAGPELIEGSVTLPGGGTLDLDPAPFTGDLFFFSGAASEELLSSVFPAGTYTLRFTRSGEPEQVIPMSLPAGDVPVPKIENFVEAQSINATQDFTLHWNEFTGAGADDYLTLSIEDDTFGFEVVFQVPNYCVPLEISATATSVVIPANTLSPDRVYQGTLTFGKSGYLSTNDVPEMAGSAGFSRMTTFTLGTGTGGAGIAATLGDVRILPNGNPSMRLTGTASRAYRIERAGSLGGSGWVQVSTVTTDGAGQATFEDISVGSYPVFYRAVTD